MYIYIYGTPYLSIVCPHGNTYKHAYTYACLYYTRIQTYIHIKHTYIHIKYTSFCKVVTSKIPPQQLYAFMATHTNMLTCMHAYTYACRHTYISRIPFFVTKPPNITIEDPTPTIE